MAHPTKTQAIAALLVGSSVRDASKRSGIPERTLFRWLADAGFMQELRRAESQALRDAVRSLSGDMERNFYIMRLFRDDQELPVNIRLRAAVAIDEAHRRWREIQDIDERLTRLEWDYDYK